MNKEIKIRNSVIAEDSRVYIIAEMSANHLGSYERAKKIIEQVKDAGADAIKFQTYTADTITLDSDLEIFQADKGGLWEGRTLYDLYQEAYTPWEWQKSLMQYAHSIGLDCFSSPFDFTAVDFMQNIDMPAFKIASYEINDIPLIKKVAKTGKPIIISTGIATMADIELALETCREQGNHNVILLKCTSAYPCPYEDMNLKVIPNMKETFQCIVGISDHTLGSEVSLGAVALGAKVVEKHVTLKRADGGADAAFSMEMNEFKEMVKQIRNLEKALGKASYELTEKQKNGRKGSRSLFVVKDMQEGEIFTEENLRSIRPGVGMHTKNYEEILGKKAAINIKKGTPMGWHLLENKEC